MAETVTLLFVVSKVLAPLKIRQIFEAPVLPLILLGTLHHAAFDRPVQRRQRD